MPAVDVIQLRAMLSEKFPGLRLRLPDPSAAGNNAWPTGLRQIDEPLGGLPKGALTEFAGAAGSATLLRALLQQAGAKRQIAALIDGADSLDITAFDQAALSRLLWVRVRSASDALQAADLILRDGNLPLVFIDLKLNPAKQLQKIPASAWYRFQRLVEQTAAVCAVFTPRPMVPSAQTRIAWRSDFSLDSLSLDAADLLRDWKLDISDARRLVEKKQSAA